MSSVPHSDSHEQGHGHGDHGHGHNGHLPFLHHHFETPVQQFESDKLGMWLFLATEILLFGGLFCAYAVYRHNHPEVFVYAHYYLNKWLGGLNTVVLIFSSFTMAWAVRAAQEGKRQLVLVLLGITMACAFAFMVVKYFEYSEKFKHGLKWGAEYKPAVHGEEHAGVPAHEAANLNAPANEHAAPAHDEHAANQPGVDRATNIAEGTEDRNVAMPVQETAALGDSSTPPALSASSDSAAQPGVSAAQAGVAPDEHLEGAPSGTQPGAVPDTQLAAAEAHGTPAESTGTPTTEGIVTAPGTKPVSAPRHSFPAGLKIEPTKVPPAAVAPSGLAAPAEHAAHAQGAEPKNVQTFFSIYFAMTGLHGVHVVIGIICIFIMMVLTAKGKFTKDYWTPIDLTGLYWHIVDLIWIFLFPLLYLIGE